MLKDNRIRTKAPRLKDHTIIDVTGKSYVIDRKTYLKKYAPGVPAWEQHYIYSYSDIYKATPEQRNFYILFKINFLNGIFFDLEGNNNYAFILLFDLFDEYESNKNFLDAQKYLNRLGDMYPDTLPYVERFLTKKREERNIKEKKGILNSVFLKPYNLNWDDEYWKLGSKYKHTLNLSNDEVKLLNRLYFPGNNFWQLEQCAQEIVKLYLATLNSLKKKYEKEGTSIEVQFNAIAVILAKYHFRYRPGSNDYKLGIESSITDLYLMILRYCENAVRDAYDHKRQVNTNLIYANATIMQEVESRITSKVSEIVSLLSPQIEATSFETELALNAQNPNRWKLRFEEITKNYAKTPDLYLEEVLDLAFLNEKNPTVENIYFEASKFISSYDKTTTLKLYIHYIYHDLQSAKFENKKLTKTIQKNLFANNEQLHDFDLIVNELTKDKDLQKALEAVSFIYVPKRKKIVLNHGLIQSVQKKHAGTVELLNEYLKDEIEDSLSSVKAEEINDEKIKLEIHQKEADQSDILYKEDVVFTSVQLALLDLFLKNNYALSSEELEAFAKSKSVFKNQLVESINDACYELLDDILIEEEDGYYAMNQNYYKRLLVI